MPGFEKLFGDSPFKALVAHGQTVNSTVQLLAPLFASVLSQDIAQARNLADRMEQCETDADELQSRILEQLAAKALLAVDRQVLYQTVERQDEMADRVEDIAVTATCRPLGIPPALHDPFRSYLAQVVECCDLVAGIMSRMDLLVELSFRGRDALTVSKLITEVDEKEDRVKAVQTTLIRRFFTADSDIPALELMLWTQILGDLGRLARAADRTAGGIRLMLKGY